jgi:hypothetical protein
MGIDEETPLETAKGQALTEELPVLYKRIVERSYYNPTVTALRQYALQQNWTLSRTLAAMLLVLMVEREGVVAELQNAYATSTRPVIIQVPK